jgi:hypothetical protein
LIPMIANARRFDCDLAPYPRLLEIEGYCVEWKPSDWRAQMRNRIILENSILSPR